MPNPKSQIKELWILEFGSWNFFFGSKETQFNRIKEVYLPPLKATKELLMSAD